MGHGLDIAYCVLFLCTESARFISGQVIYGAPVLSQAQAFPLRGEAFGIAAVGQSGARDEIRAAMAAAGWIETLDFCCAA